MERDNLTCEGDKGKILLQLRAANSSLLATTAYQLGMELPDNASSKPKPKIGVMSYSVERRERSGVRPREALLLVVGPGMTLALLGVLIRADACC